MAIRFSTFLKLDGVHLLDPSQLKDDGTQARWTSSRASSVGRCNTCLQFQAQIVNDKGRYRQHRAIFQTSQATIASKNFVVGGSSARMSRVGRILSPVRRGPGIVDVNVLYHALFRLRSNPPIKLAISLASS